jgi:hypothetical protein
LLEYWIVEAKEAGRLVFVQVPHEEDLAAVA